MCDHHDNFHVNISPHTPIISYLLNHSNVIGVKNHSRHRELDLGKSWLVKDTYFRLVTKLSGVVIIDLWKAYWYHLCHKYWDKSMTVRKFSPIL